MAEQAKAPVLETGPWSKEDMDKLISMSARGNSALEVAGKLNRGVKAVENKRFRCKAQIEARSKTGKSKAKSKPVDFEAHLKTVLNPDWTAQMALRFAELIAKGTGSAGAGAVMRMDKETARDRWAALHPTQKEEDLPRLIEALQALVVANSG